MALNFEQATASTTKTTAERAKTKVWLNIGYERAGKDINLPVGIPIDTTEKLEIRGSNKDWNDFQTARNAFLDFLQKAGANLEPGAEEEITGLTIKLKHVGNTEVSSEADTEFASDMSFIKIGA